MLSSQVKFSADRQIDGQTDKTIIPRSIDEGGIKNQRKIGYLQL